ncbi:MAG: hypothetical protein NVSMB32_04900 [Actinomycetota bacterium]
MRRVRVGRALLYLTLVALLIPVIAFVIARLTGSGPFAGHLFPVTLHNDTATTVVVRRCGTKCTVKDQSVTLGPGKAVQVGVADGAVVTPYYLYDLSGALRNCLPLQANAALPGITVEISRAQTCPGAPVMVR